MANPKSRVPAQGRRSWGSVLPLPVPERRLGLPNQSALPQNISLAKRGNRASRAGHWEKTSEELPGGRALQTPLGWIGLFFQRQELARVVLAGNDWSYLAKSAYEMASLGGADESEPAWAGALVDAFYEYSLGNEVDFARFPLARRKFTPFQKNVLLACQGIPFGKTMSYGELAANVGAPQGARAVGNVMRGNQTPIIIPCHRVIAAGNRWGGFSACDGVSMKIRLLRLEGIGLSGP